MKGLSNLFSRLALRSTIDANVFQRCSNRLVCRSHGSSSKIDSEIDRSSKLSEANEKRTPRGRLDNLAILPKKSTLNDKGRHRDAEKEPLSPWPDSINPHTGEKGGPKGPEPTRYGDWERKGRVSDF